MSYIPCEVIKQKLSEMTSFKQKVFACSLDGSLRTDTVSYRSTRVTPIKLTRQPLFKDFRLMFIMMRIFGLPDASNSVSCKVSLWFRLYVYAMCLGSFALSIVYIYLTFNPDNASFPIFQKLSKNQAIIFPSYCLLCSLLRFVFTVLSLNSKYAQERLVITSQIFTDAYFVKYFRPSKRVIRIASLVTPLTLLSVMISNSAIFIAFSATWSEPFFQISFYMFILEVVIITAGGLFPVTHFAVFALSVVRPLFLLVNRGFSEIITNRNHFLVEEFKANVRRHTVIWKLVNHFDKVASWIIGLTVTFSVPVFCLVTTQIVSDLMTPTEKTEVGMFATFLTLGFWAGSLIALTAFLIIVAAAAREAAHGSAQTLLMLNTDFEADSTLSHFTQRLTSMSIGYSYFKIFTVQKTTLLTVFNLMVTYLIVGLQMLQGSSPSPVK